MSNVKVPMVTEINKNSGQVGDVVDSVLDEATIQTVRGPGWVLMDGRSIVGTRLATLTGWTSLPDHRGVFRRAKNNGRNDGNENPDGELAVGSFQSDKVAGHSHRMFAHESSNADGAFGNVARTGNAGSADEAYRMAGNAVAEPTRGDTSVVGGNETNPKNVTVNTYIRIN